MQLSTYLTALPLESADRVRLEPYILDETGNAILIDAQLRHIPPVNHIAGSYQ